MREADRELLAANSEMLGPGPDGRIEKSWKAIITEYEKI